LDRIREILLGSSVDELASRISKLGDRVQEVDADLRGEMDRRMGSIDESITARLKESARADVESREALLSELAALRKEVARVREELLAAMKRSVADLDAEKVDRFMLSRILADASVRLQGQSPSDSGEVRSDG
jgi:hypothetical protein